MADDVFSMRQDAVRRAREMYSRARPGPAREAAEHNAERPAQQPAEPQAERAAPREPGHSETEKGPDGFEAFFKDKEKMMILALLVILSQESCDNSLLFSLMFLLL